MWNSPNQKIKKLQNSKKSPRTQGRIPVHFQRINAELKTSGTDSTVLNTEVRLLLNDISETGAGLYSPINVQTTEIVTLELANPLPAKIRGKIVWCQEFNMGSHILTNNHFRYRIGIEFVTETDEEKKSIKDLCAHIAKVIELE